MLEISVLRALGACLAAVFLLHGFFQLRRQTGAPGMTVLSLLTGAGLAAAAALPDMVGAIAWVLFDHGGQQGIAGGPGARLFVVLLAGLAASWAVSLFLLGRSERTRASLDRLIRHTVLRDTPTRGAAIGPASIVVAIPAYNEAANLPGVLRAMPATVDGHPVCPLVIDDGSTDATAEVARAHGAVVAAMPFNRGGGAALRVGYDLAVRTRAAALVTLDADGQNAPDEMPPLLDPILTGRAEVVIGSRRLGRHDVTVWWRDLGVRVFTRLMNALMGTRLTDVSSGYRAMAPDALARLRLTQDQYHTSEFLIMAAKHGLTMTERPIHFRRRASGASKKGNEVLYGLRFAWVLITSWLRPV
jgi:hypothetical protein